MVYRTITPHDDSLVINRHDIRSMGINPIGLDYCRVEDIIGEISSKLKVPHRHEYYEIIWFTHCSGSHMVEFAHYDLQPNMLFFLPKNQIHAFLTTENIKGHMLRFDESFLKLMEGSKAIQHSLFKIHSSPVRCLPEEKIPVFDAIIRLLREELTKGEELHHLVMLSVLLNAFLIESERISPAQDNMIDIDEKNLEKFYQFTTLLENNFRNHYSVRHYAEMMHITAKVLRTICKQISGLPVKALIQDRVALEAKLYLQNSDLDIQEISYKLGFEDPSYFSRYFKKATDTSPSSFRTQKGAKVSS